MHIRTLLTERMQNLRYPIFVFFVHSYHRKRLPNVVRSPIQVNKAITIPSFRGWHIYLQGNFAKLIEIRVLQSNTRGNGLAKLTALAGIFPYKPKSFKTEKSNVDIEVVFPEVFQAGCTRFTESGVFGETHRHLNSLYSMNEAPVSNVGNFHKCFCPARDKMKGGARLIWGKKDFRGRLWLGRLSRS